jgi:hypothetical protein
MWGFEVTRAKRWRLKAENAKARLCIERDADKPPGKGIRDGVPVPRDVKNAEVNGASDEDATGEEENRIVGGGGLQGIEHLDSVQIVSENRKARGWWVEGSGEVQS